MPRGQVWVETVVYTLIGLSLIGLVLALITPRINEYRDRTVIEQTISSLNVIDAKINELLYAPGNTRVVDFLLKRGSLSFNASSDQIVYVLEDSKTLYSEPGQPVAVGRISVLTTKGTSANRIALTLSYDVDLDYEENTTLKQYSAASTPYRFSFSHRGFVSNATSTRPIIFVRELSSGA